MDQPINVASDDICASSDDIVVNGSSLSAVSTSSIAGKKVDSRTKI
jgi:hypothetical protein